MDYLYVAWQDENTREWIPVAKLKKGESGYFLQYTRGAKRCNNFSGLGRMNELDKIYYSEELFPFFRNRIISNSRPEYNDYMRWLGLEEVQNDAFSLMAITAGLRATDSFVVIQQPNIKNNQLFLNFFPRGLKYLSKNEVEFISELKPTDRLYLLIDIQNEFDKNAILLRTDTPKKLIGYIPKYYCRGLSRLLESSANKVSVVVKRVNLDAPLDMRLLCTLSAPWNENSHPLDDEEDFLPWSLKPVIIGPENSIQESDLRLNQ
jgi:hypothetical protein